MIFPRRATLLLALPLLAFGAVSLQVAPAFAEDDAVVDMARQRFAEGVKYYDTGDYERARAAFLQAYALKKHPSVLLNLAQCELRSGHPADAANHFTEYLRSAADEASPEERATATEGLEQAKASVGEVVLQVDVDGAEVYLDGESVGRSPLGRSLFMLPGEHELAARKHGNEATTNVTAATNTTVTADLRLATPPPATAAEDSQEDASGQPISFGDYLTGHPVAWVGMGLTGAGIGLGIAGAITAKSRYDAANDISSEIIESAVQAEGTIAPHTPLCRGARSEFPNAETRAILSPDCARRQEMIQDGATSKTVAITSFVVSGAAAVGTVAYYLIARPTKSDADGRDDDELALTPVLTAEQQGLLLRGRF